jgi:hypothetical protein
MDSSSYAGIKDFLKLFALTTRSQRLALLRGITKKQCAIIRQLAYNILFNSSIDLSNSERAYLKQNSIEIKQLASRKVSLDRKKDILLRRHLLIKRMALIALKYLS